MSPADSTLLRAAFGVERPSRLYVSDSTSDGLLKYDTARKRCRTCYVNSYVVGFTSVRRPDESWEQVEERLRHTLPQAIPASHRAWSTDIAAMDPRVQSAVRTMLARARAAGFAVRVGTTYRSPAQEAYLMVLGDRSGDVRTHTLTSMHSYGRALDVLVGDGNPSHATTRRQWIRFREWVTTYPGGVFRILGRPDSTWDWPHVEVPTARLGFRSVDAALAAARTCAGGAPRRAPEVTTDPCLFHPHVPARDSVAHGILPRHNR